MSEPTQGVYCIRHRPSGRRYIGSSRTIEWRFDGHRDELTKGIHHTKKFQALWNETNPDDWEWEVLETTTGGTRDDLFWVEQKYLNKWWDSGLLLNSSKNAAGSFGKSYLGNRPISWKEKVLFSLYVVALIFCCVILFYLLSLLTQH